MNLRYATLVTILGFSLLFHFCSPAVRFQKDEGSKKVERNIQVKNEPSSQDSSYEVVEGKASYYDDDLHGQLTTSGEPYNKFDYTGAHPTYPMGTVVKITNLINNKSVKLRINDRCAGIKGRIIDVSRIAAQDLDMLEAGVVDVKLEVLEWGEPQE